MMKIVVDCQYEDFNKEFESIDAMVEFFTDKLWERDGEITRLEEQNEVLESNVGHLEDKVSELEERYAECEEELSAAVADYENVKAELEDFNKGKEE